VRKLNQYLQIDEDQKSLHMLTIEESYSIGA